MNRNVEFLNYIYQNSKMGEDTITQLIKITESEDIKSDLENHLKGYRKILDKCNNKLEELNKESKDLSAWTKITTYLMITMNTMTDKSASHISEMLIQGSTMGVIDITKKLNEYENTMEDIKQIAKELQSIEQTNIDDLKKFIG